MQLTCLKRRAASPEWTYNLSYDFLGDQRPESSIEMKTAADLLKEFQESTRQAIRFNAEATSQALGAGDLSRAGDLHAALRNLLQLEDLLFGKTPPPAKSVDVVPVVEPISPPAWPEAPPPNPQLRAVTPARKAPASMPAPVPEPAPDPEPQPAARPIPKPKTVVAGPKLRSLRETFFSDAGKLMGDSSPDAPSVAAFKATICLGKALEELEKTNGERELVKEELRHLNVHWDSVLEGLDFFGFNPARGHKAEIWLELHSAYETVAVAERCMTWLESDPPVTAEKRQRLLSLCAAAETLLLRLFDDRALVAQDRQQQDLHKRIRLSTPDFIEWWTQAGNGGPSTAKIRQASSGLEDLFQECFKELNNKDARDQAVNELDRLLKEGESLEDYVERLASATLACLATGVPPSNKSLVECLLPYRPQLAELNLEGLKKILDFTKKREMQMIANREVILDNDIPPDPEHQARLEDLRKVLDGKVMVWLGGNKRQAARREIIEQQLKLKELVWPDSEDATHIDQLRVQAQKADFVVQLIRWSRHSYRLIVNEAKAQGKQVAVLTSGLGENKVVLDLHAQLCARSASGTPRQAAGFV